MLDDIMRQHENDSVCVLFPTNDAISADEYIAQRRKRFNTNNIVNDTTNKNSNTCIAPPLTVIVLDGTGRQARSLQRFIPEEIPRISLPTPSSGANESWLNKMRLQTEKHRVCSAQAAAIVLEMAGDTEVADNIEDAVRVLVADAERDRAIHSLPEKVLNL